MMLIAAFGASIGGIGTPIGTPPNLIGIGMLNRIAGVQITFFQWMLLGVPIVVLLFGFLVAYFYFRCSARRDARRPARADRDRTRSCAGSDRCRAAQRNVLIAFGVTVALWLMPGRPGHRRGWATSAFARGLRDGRAGSGGGHGRGDPAVPPAGELARAPVHADMGGGGPDRLGHHPAVRRRPGDGGAGVLDRPGRGDGTWHHVVAAGALDRWRSRSSSPPSRS